MIKQEYHTYTVKVDEETCVGCGSCVKVCGMGVLEMGEKGPVLAHPEQCIGCTHCTAVCPTRAMHAVKRPNAPADQPEPVPTEDYGDKNPFMPLEDIALHVSARRSIRHFKPEAPSREVLDSVIQACRYAPTACNFRKLRYAVIREPEHIKTLREMLEKVVPATLTLMPAPALLLIINDLPLDFAHDTTIAATTFDLVARSVGIGSTFAGIVRRAILQSEDIRKYLADVCGIKDLDGHYFQALYLGYPSDDVTFLRPAVRDPAKVTWA